MSVRGERLVIVGGGIGGLCLAAALTQCQVPWLLVERARALEPKGTGIALMPPALRVLERLGLMEAAKATSFPMPGTRRFRGDGKLLFDVSYGDIWGAETRSIHRADLQAILLSAATGGEVFLDRPLRSARANGSSIELQFDSNTLTCDFLVGADGVRSAVRRSIGGAEARLLGQKIYRAHTTVSGLVDRHTLFLGRRAVFGLVPLLNGTYLFVNAFNDEDKTAGPVAGRRARLMEVLSDIKAPEAQRAIALWPCDSDIYDDASWEVPVSGAGWRQGRILLIGDAAHAMSPVLAVGAAVAMEDAWVLADELSRHENIDTALDAFVARRTPRVHWIQTASAEIVQRAKSGQRAPDLASELTSAYTPLRADP